MATSRNQLHSSANTFFQKLVTPVVVLVAGPTSFSTGRTARRLPESWHGLLPWIWLAATIWLIWRAVRLMAVEADDRNLYISNYLQKITVPLTQVKGVVESIGRFKTVTISFTERTTFGKDVLFVPSWRPFPMGEHATTQELRAKVEASRKHPRNHKAKAKR